MHVIKPFAVILPADTPPIVGGWVKLNATSLVAEDATLAWVSGTYAVGDERHVVATHRVYKCAAAGTSTVSPELDPTRWTDMRPTNKWAAFDFYQNTKSTSTSDLYFALLCGDFFVNSIAVFGIIGNYVRVEVFDAAGVSIYVNTQSAMRDAVDWDDYFFGFTLYIDNIVNGLLPIGVGYKIRVTIIGSGTNTRAVGTICLGRKMSIDGETTGGTQWGAVTTPLSRSSNKINDDGTIKIIKRGKYRIMDCDVVVPIEYMDCAVEIIEDTLGEPCAWIATEYHHANKLRVFGQLKDAPASYQNVGVGGVKFKIEGIV